MDGLKETISKSAFTAIIGSIYLYKQENPKDQDFFEWLDYHNHDKIKELIIKEQGLMAEVMHISLRFDNEKLQKCFDHLNERIASFANKLPELKRLVEIIHPNVDKLSAQAVYFLNILRDHPKGATLTPLSEFGDGLILVDGGLLRILNLERLDEDLAVLVDSGFLCKQSRDGTIQFSITIFGIAYINQCGKVFG